MSFTILLINVEKQNIDKQYAAFKIFVVLTIFELIPVCKIILCQCLCNIVLSVEAVITSNIIQIFSIVTFKKIRISHWRKNNIGVLLCQYCCNNY